MTSQSQTFSDLIESVAQRNGSRIALKFGERTTTYRMLGERTRRLARALASRGIGHGDRIAYLGKNTDRFFELVIAASRLSAVTVPIGWRLSPFEVNEILDDCAARILFVDDYGASQCGTIFLERGRNLSIVSIDGSDEVYADYEALIEEIEDAPISDLGAKPSDAFLQLYTSGTTGRPKGVVLSQHCFFSLRRERKHGVAQRWDEWDEGDVALMAMPIAHIGGTGLGLLSLYNGVTGIVASEFRPEECLEFIQKDGVNRIFLVPSAIKIILDSPLAAKTDFSRMKTIVYGSSPIPLDLLREAVSVFRCGFVQTYGMTETMGTIVHLPADDHDINGNERMRSAGIPMEGVEIRILGSDGKPMQNRDIGEIVTRSPANMMSYWNNPEATAETLDGDGWLHTGDAGYLDEDGYVYIVDRIKEMIISGGENVYPAEVENAIYGHPAVSEVAVIGLPDPKWGEVVTAVVVPRQGVTSDPSDIIAWARTRIAAFKAPKTVLFIEQLPKNATGKTLRRTLKEALLRQSVSG